MKTSLTPAFAADIPGADVLTHDYDVVLVAIGYEKRSRHLACNLRGNLARKIAIPFENDRVLSFADNYAALEQLDYSILEVPERDVLSLWKKELSDAQRALSTSTLRICIDISSITRLRLAHLIEGLVTHASAQPIQVDFVYTVARFTPPPESSEAATICGPVSTYMAGWPADPDKPLAAVIGLGYELEKAIGALEYMEPATKVLIKPISKDSRFDDQVDAANRQLLGTESLDETFSYPIDQPTQCLELIDALIHGLRDEHRIVAIPFGPKIFALCCMLIACRYYPEIGIWRISAEESRSARDQEPSDTTVGLRIRFDPKSAA